MQTHHPRIKIGFSPSRRVAAIAVHIALAAVLAFALVSVWAASLYVAIYPTNIF